MYFVIHFLFMRPNSYFQNVLQDCLVSLERFLLAVSGTLVLRDNDKMFVHGNFPLCFQEDGRSSKLLPRQSQELASGLFLLPLASDSNLVLITSPVSAAVSSDILKALGNCLVQVALEEASRLLLLNSLITALTTRPAVGRALGRLGAAQLGWQPRELQRPSSSGEGFWSMPADRKICAEFGMCRLTLDRVLAARRAARLRCFVPSVADRSWERRHRAACQAAGLQRGAGGAGTALAGGGGGWEP